MPFPQVGVLMSQDGGKLRLGLKGAEEPCRDRDIAGRAPARGWAMASTDGSISRRTERAPPALRTSACLRRERTWIR